MKNAIWKYGMPAPGDTMVHHLPRGARCVHVDIQEHESFPIQAWFLVDLTQPTEPRTFRVIATGQPFAEGVHLGTVIHAASRTVWHILEVTD